MKIHVGKLLDRSLYPRPHLTVQGYHGHIVTVYIPDRGAADAGRRYGGEWVAYVYQGGRATYITQTERDDIEREEQGR